MTVALVTGATGYVGGRLVPELLADGHQVRCLVRTPFKLADEGWRDQVDVVEGGVTDDAALSDAMAGVDVAYYLVHSMGGPAAFEEEDRRVAQSFRDAAAAAGVSRIIYLGGLGCGEDPKLSRHLRSRQ